MPSPLSNKNYIYEQPIPAQYKNSAAKLAEWKAMSPSAQREILIAGNMNVLYSRKTSLEAVVEGKDPEAIKRIKDSEEDVAKNKDAAIKKIAAYEAAMFDIVEADNINKKIISVEQHNKKLGIQSSEIDKKIDVVNKNISTVNSLCKDKSFVEWNKLSSDIEKQAATIKTNELLAKQTEKKGFFDKVKSLFFTPKYYEKKAISAKANLEKLQEKKTKLESAQSKGQPSFADKQNTIINLIGKEAYNNTPLTKINSFIFEKEKKNLVKEKAEVTSTISTNNQLIKATEIKFDKATKIADDQMHDLDVAPFPTAIKPLHQPIILNQNNNVQPVNAQVNAANLNNDVPSIVVSGTMQKTSQDSNLSQTSGSNSLK